MFVTDLHDLSPIISITFFFSVVIVPSEDLPRRRVEAYTRGEGGCQGFFLFFKPGVPDGPPGYEYGAFQAHKESCV